jgi:uncharacterized protein
VLPEALAAVLARSSSVRSPIHGPDHWRAVASVGLALAEQDGRVDRLVVVLFGLFHDALRVSDGSDPMHGPRAALLARNLNRDVLRLSEARLALLTSACEWHTLGWPSDDPTVGACWDADRLDLRRLGIVPRPGSMSTAAGRRLAGPGIRREPPAWEDIFAALTAPVAAPLTRKAGAALPPGSWKPSGRPPGGCDT